MVKINKSIITYVYWSIDIPTVVFILEKSLNSIENKKNIKSRIFVLGTKQEEENKLIVAMLTKIHQERRNKRDLSGCQNI